MVIGEQQAASSEQRLKVTSRRAIPHTNPILWTTVVNVYREILP